MGRDDFDWEDDERIAVRKQVPIAVHASGSYVMIEFPSADWERQNGGPKTHAVFVSSNNVEPLCAALMAAKSRLEGLPVVPISGPPQCDPASCLSLKGALLAVATAYSTATGLQMKTVSWKAFGDSNRLPTMFETDADITTGRFESSMQWFSENWPEDAEWPTGSYPRPSVKGPVAHG